MPRYLHEDATKLYRVVVVGLTGHKTIYGPYEYKRSAGYVKSYMTGGWFSSHISDSWIEVSEPSWKRDG